jgi:hypothetical protein
MTCQSIQCSGYRIRSHRHVANLENKRAVATALLLLHVYPARVLLLASSVRLVKRFEIREQEMVVVIVDPQE